MVTDDAWVTQVVTVLLRGALALSVVWCCACSSEEPLDLCATLPVTRGEVVGTGSVRMTTAGVEVNTSEARIGSASDNLVVVKFCEPRQARLSAAYLAWTRYPDVPLPAPIRLFNGMDLNPRPINAFYGSWKSCDSDDCTVENGRVHFESWLRAGSRYGAGEITAWDPQAGHMAAWAMFDTYLTTYCDEDGKSPRGPCNEICGTFDDPCRHDIGEHIEIEVDVTWTPSWDAGVMLDDGGT